ncbi:PQQ-dependent dehydrogenase, methanol/ethanol family [Burkholderiales bacterium]|jgi:alcohol dehydrogenase (cytochrome c)|nr:PQQ-dependent dehydrogenase, methanol/ethanol family [Burkholderiales bacterium]
MKLKTSLGRFGVALAGATLAFSAIAGTVTTDRLVNSEKEPENWLNHHGNLEAHRYSGLAHINKDNVQDLKVAFTYAMGGTQGGGKEVIAFPFAGLEGTPIAEDGFLYLTTGWGVVTKLDTNGGSPRIVWVYDPAPDRDYATTVACCGINNRGVALADDYVISPVIDGRILALNKIDGTLVWEAQVADPGNGETITGAPLIAGDKVVTGMAGAEFGVRGYLEAMDIKTGEQVWRTYTIPAPGEPGSETWKDDYGAWKTGGGTTWVTGSWDPELNIIVWGTANPGPDWDSAYRPGDNLWTDSTIAVDADSGEIVWGFQHTPNDPYDFDSINENTFVDTNIEGKFQRATLHANRNGYAYALDRVTGKCLWATQFVEELNWSGGLDENCRPNTYDPNKDVQTYVPGTAAMRGTATEGRGTIEGTLKPGHMGGKNWPPTAYSPQTNYYYIPTIDGCNKAFTEVTVPGQHKPRQLFLGGAPYSTYEDPDCGRIWGSITAIDVQTGKVVAKHSTKYPQLGGLLTTAGGLVFSGYAEGAVVAHDAVTLEELWRFETGSAINAPPMTYMAGGKQYIAIEVGLGGAWPQWFVSATPELKAQVPSNVLYVFELPN